MRSLRHAAMAAVLGLTVATTVATTAGTAFAATPSNDTYAGRAVVGAVPFGQTLDTSAATTDADDTAINSQCGAPATDASVWYQLTATTTGALLADVSSSTYSAGALVATGAPGNFTVLACGPGATSWSTTAGETYTILVFDDQLDGGGNGGTLNLTIDVAPPPPTVDVTVNPTATFNSKTGAVAVSGTVNCTGRADFAFFEVDLAQTVGRFIIRGFSGTDITCDGVTRPWSLQVYGDNGKFAGGKAASVTFALACGSSDCGVDFEERIIQIKGGGKR